MTKLNVGPVNSMHSILEIARRVLRAEILAKEGHLERSINLLQEAVTLEDALGYNEPPDWFFSIRHNVGAVLLKAKRYKEAEAVFATDLTVFPRNGWALSGLYQAQVSQGFTDKAKQTQVVLTQAWRWADSDVKAGKISRL